MNGTLTPEDTPGGGLTMVVSLPFAEQTEQAEQAEQIEQAESSEYPHPRGAQSVGGV
jgi:two-component system sensor histidine kinase KdpD